MNGNTLQVILLVVATAVTITVADNLIASIRAEEAARHREALTNQTLLEQERHHNATQIIFENLATGIERQEDTIAKLDQIINNTS